MIVEIIVDDKNKGFKVGQIKKNLNLKTCESLIKLKVAKEYKKPSPKKTADK